MTVVAVDDRAWPDDTHRRTPALLPRWMAYALDPADHAGAVRREVDTQINRRPELAGHRGLLTDLLASKSAGARQDGAAFGALRYEERGGDGSSIVSMVGWLVDRNPRLTVADEVADNLARLSVATGMDRHPPRVTPVHLPYGPGVRVEATRRAPPGAGVTLEHRMVSRSVEYHVPLDRPAASLLFVRFLTSDLAGAARLADEFEAIVAAVPRPSGR